MAQDSRSPTFPTIPMPAADTDALFHTCMTMKEAIETLQGVRGVVAAARVFVRNDPPGADRDGDFWLSVGTSTTLNISYAGKWLVVGTLS